VDWKNQCVALIPCFNEVSHIGELVAVVRPFIPHILVIDDGSTDDTARIAEKAGATVIRCERNIGKGRALRAGWEQAQNRGFKWALMLDGDGQHAPTDIPEFLRCAGNSGASLVVGNRMLDTKTMPFIRRQANRWMSHRISQLVGTAVPDSQCGFRLARLDLLLQLPILTNRFEVESSMLTSFFQHQQKVEFVPIKTIYRSAKSNIRPLTDTWRWLRWRLDQRADFRACMTMRVP
jgi:glycosyltransferase involved in cell wall biosynthesis